MENETINETQPETETVITVGDSVTLNAKIAELEYNLRRAQHKFEQQENWLDKYRKRNEQLCEAIWPSLEDKILSIIDNAVHDQLEDIDITAHGYFDTAVCEVIRDYDFSDLIKEVLTQSDLDYRVAKVINNGEFRLAVGGLQWISTK